MHRASDEIEQADWLDALREAAAGLDLSTEARSCAVDLFLAGVPEADRSKAPAVAASLYAASLISGEERSQAAVADAVGVSRLAVQDRWKDRLAEAGFEPPDW